MDRNYDIFQAEMKQCGYDVNKPKNDEQRQLIAVAKVMWDSQQMRIDATESKITRYRNALEAL